MDYYQTKGDHYGAMLEGVALFAGMRVWIRWPDGTESVCVLNVMDRGGPDPGQLIVDKHYYVKDVVRGVPVSVPLERGFTAAFVTDVGDAEAFGAAVAVTYDAAKPGFLVGEEFLETGTVVDVFYGKQLVRGKVTIELRGSGPSYARTVAAHATVTFTCRSKELLEDIVPGRLVRIVR